MSNLFETEEENYLHFDTGEGSSVNTEELLEPKESSLFLSDQSFEQDFINFLSNEKVPHAVIFSGDMGIGKSTFAYRLTRFLLKYGKAQSQDAGLFGDAAPVILPESMDVPADDPVFRKVLSGGHPDFLALEPAEGKKGLDVEQIRKVAPFLRKTASEDGGWRIVLIDEANTMNRNAQNALLKILEEPPERTLLMLISHNSAAFLPTIHSRCRLFQFEAPSMQIYERLLFKKDPHLSPDKLKSLFEYSSGSIGQTINFIEFNGLDLMEQTIQHFGSLPNPDYEQIHLFCEQFSRNAKPETWQIFYDLTLWIFEELVLAKAKKHELISSLSNLSHLNNLCSLEEQVEICQMLEGKFQRADRSNLDKRQTALEIFMVLEEILKKDKN